MTSHTERLAKGLGYPSRPAVLKAAIEEAAIDIERTLRRCASGAFFECYFWPKNLVVGRERLYFPASAVKSGNVASARHYFEQIVLPEALAWAKRIVAQSMNSTGRREKQYFSRVLPDDLVHDRVDSFRGESRQ